VQATAGRSLLVFRAIPAASAVLGITMVGVIAAHLRSGEGLYALIPVAMPGCLVLRWYNRMAAGKQ